jgi:mono/diheme cytochrome c family protein
MRKVSIFVVLACLLVSCESTNYVPSVTSQMATARKGQHVDLAMLRNGRALFVSRCIECHTLPAVWRYSVEDWPELVDKMSGRATLKPMERDAIIAYILAIRSTKQ